MSRLAASQRRRLLAFILSIGGFALLALGVHVEAFLAVLAGATLLVVAAAARWRRVSFACALVAAALIATGAAEIVLRSGGPAEDETFFRPAISIITTSSATTSVSWQSRGFTPSAKRRATER